MLDGMSVDYESAGARECVARATAILNAIGSCPGTKGAKINEWLRASAEARQWLARAESHERTQREAKLADLEEQFADRGDKLDKVDKLKAAHLKSVM